MYYRGQEELSGLSLEFFDLVAVTDLTPAFITQAATTQVTLTGSDLDQLECCTCNTGSCGLNSGGDLIVYHSH